MKKELLNPVVLSNELARYSVMDFSVTGWRIFLYAISKVQPTDCEFRPEEIRLRDFCKLFNITSYEDVRNACWGFADAKIEVKDKTFSVFEYCECADNIICFRLSSDLEEFLLFQIDNMTIFDLGYIRNLSSKYAIRFYVFSASYKSLHTYNMSFKNFANIIKTNHSPGDVIRRILTPAMNSINTLTNIKVNIAKTKDRYYFYARERYKNERDEIKLDEWRVEALKDKEEASISFEETEKMLFKEEFEEEEKLSLID